MELSKGLLLIIATASWVINGLLCEHQWDGEYADDTPYLQEKQNVPPPPLDIRPLIVNGPSSNRVDIIFFGDGCA